IGSSGSGKSTFLRCVNFLEKPFPSDALLDSVRRALEVRRLVLENRTLRLALACLLARGHLLIEDLPGMGKT
ncbi:hypothetical protein IBT50_27035, partial [Bacillus sp. S70]|nr:hypothetical protein [Bacillus sp. S70]